MFTVQHHILRGYEMLVLPMRVYPHVHRLVGAHITKTINHGTTHSSHLTREGKFDRE